MVIRLYGSGNSIFLKSFVYTAFTVVYPPTTHYFGNSANSERILFSSASAYAIAQRLRYGAIYSVMCSALHCCQLGTIPCFGCSQTCLSLGTCLQSGPKTPMSLLEKKVFCFMNQWVQWQAKFACLNSVGCVSDDGWGNCLRLKLSVCSQQLSNFATLIYGHTQSTHCYTM